MMNSVMETPPRGIVPLPASKWYVQPNKDVGSESALPAYEWHVEPEHLRDGQDRCTDAQGGVARV